MKWRMDIFICDRKVVLGEDAGKKPGKTYMYVRFVGEEIAEMPDAPTMERLVSDYLEGGYEEAFRSNNYRAFHANAGASEEKKASFHAALCTHIRVVVR